MGRQIQARLNGEHQIEGNQIQGILIFVEIGRSGWSMEPDPRHPLVQLSQLGGHDVLINHAPASSDTHPASAHTRAGPYPTR